MLLGRIVEFPLMAQPENAHSVRDGQVPVESEVSGYPERNHQFAHFALPYPPDERMTREDVHGGPDCVHCIERGLGILVGQEVEHSFKVAQSDR